MWSHHFGLRLGEERPGGPTRVQGRADQELQDQPRMELGHQSEGHQSEGADFSTEAVAMLRGQLVGHPNRQLITIRNKCNF